jgi:DNA-binding NtrC family response regulator
MPANILVVDDEATLCQNIATFLREQGHNVNYSHSESNALTLLRRQAVDIVLTDLRLGEGDGMDLLKQIHTLAPLTVVLVMTAYGSVDSAVEAFRNGAHDYLIKPFALDELGQKVKNIEEYRRLIRQNSSLRQEVQRRHNPSNIVFRSSALNEVLDIVKKVSQSASNVLVTGETGTGKELIARAIHDLGPLREAVFLPVNVAAIPDNLVESNLFGHTRGAFTGAERSREGAFRAAADGTLFLDEIGDLPLHIQPKLLRALEEKEIIPVGSDTPILVNTRVIAATNCDLEKMAREGRFRRDLLMRLNVVVIHIPPLRERMDDVPLLVQHFVRRHCHELGKPILEIDMDAMHCLMSYHWRRGNVRELSNVIERAAILSEGQKIGREDLPVEMCDGDQHRSLNMLSLRDAVNEFERRHVASVLESVEGSRDLAASVLGVSPATLYRHLDKLGLKGYRSDSDAHIERVA